MDKVRTFAYKINFELDGYEPREVSWVRFRPANQRLWKQVAAGYVMQWKGLDLEPNLETLKKNFAHLPM